MTWLLYQIAVFATSAFIPLVSFFNNKLALRQKGIRDTFQGLRAFNPDGKRVFWMHCASLGEFEQGRPVLEKFKSQNPDYLVVLSFFSPSGFEQRRNYASADFVCYLPWDTRTSARRFVNLLRAEKAVFVKYDIWPNIILESKRFGTELFLISARFRKEQAFFKPWGGTLRNALKDFNRIFVQDENSIQLLHSIQIPAIRTGDTRFDRVAEIAQKPWSHSQLESWSQRAFTVVAGSTWPQDETLLKQWLDANPDVQILIAPHEISSNHLTYLKKLFNGELSLFSEIGSGPMSRVVCVDSIGLLSRLYRFGQYAYLGGGFGKGIHNTLEAVVYGIPVIFGPNYHKFDEAHELISRGIGMSISDFSELNSAHHEWFGNKASRKEAGDKALRFVQENVGAADRIIALL